MLCQDRYCCQTGRGMRGKALGKTTCNRRVTASLSKAKLKLIRDNSSSCLLNCGVTSKIWARRRRRRRCVLGSRDLASSIRAAIHSSTCAKREREREREREKENQDVIQSANSFQRNKSIFCNLQQHDRSEPQLQYIREATHIG
jgi:hypothetical protein